MVNIPKTDKYIYFLFYSRFKILQLVGFQQERDFEINRNVWTRFFWQDTYSINNRYSILVKDFFFLQLTRTVCQTWINFEELKILCYIQEITIEM